MRRDLPLPPTIAKICLVAFGAVGLLGDRVINYPVSFIGIPCILAGVYLNWNAAKTFRQNGINILPNSKTIALTRSGVFRYSRNPMYLGIFLALLGVGFLIGSITSIAGALVFAIVMQYTWIPYEERKLKQSFGVEFEQYCRTVRRWV